MEKLKTKYGVFVKAFNSFEISINKFNELNDNDYYYDEVRDSVIKRFTYTMDIFWKMLREFLIDIYGLEAIPSPKAIFRACFDTKVITEEEYCICIKLTDDRNMCSHTYNEIVAQEILNAIPSYYVAMKVISTRISSQCFL